MKKPGPVRVDSMLDQVLQKHGVRDQVERMGVLELWPELVGEHIAEVTRARAVSDRTLIVEVRSSAWMAELTTMRRALLTKVNEAMPDLPMDRIVFVLAETW